MVSVKIPKPKPSMKYVEPHGPLAARDHTRQLRIDRHFLEAVFGKGLPDYKRLRKYFADDIVCTGNRERRRVSR